jgi:PAS domain S-box-containing protein
MLRGLFAVLNLGVVGVACALLGGDAPAWILAVPVALAAPARLLGSEGARVLKLLGLAVVVGVGQFYASVALVDVGVSLLVLGALAVVPFFSTATSTLQAELSRSRAALEVAHQSSNHLEAQLMSGTERLEETERVLTARFERRFAEAAAHQSEILAAVVDAVFAVDDKGVVTSCNPAGERLLRATEEGIVGQHLNSFLPQAKPGALALLARTSRLRVAKGEAAQMRELTCIPQRGPQLEVEIAVGALPSRDGAEGYSPATYTVVVRDISLRKEVERMKDELVATVSHELRTPMTAILGSLKLMAGGAVGPLPPKATELLELAQRNGNRLVDLINDLLDIQKMEEGKLAFQMRRCSLAEICEQAVKTARPMGESVGVSYRFTATDALPEVWADASRIEQVVANLLSNATKFSPKGGTVTVQVDASAAERVRVEVTDQGPGLPEGIAEKVFERFVQGESGDTRSSGGTGLGLTIARSIVERHGGEIGVTSQPGRGASFFFELPSAKLVGRGHTGPIEVASAS